MSTGKRSCPRCEQDWLIWVAVVPLCIRAVKCPECDALWLDADWLRSPADAEFGVNWFDYGTFMERRGIPDGWASGVLRREGYFGLEGATEVDEAKAKGTAARDSQREDP